MNTAIGGCKILHRVKPRFEVNQTGVPGVPDNLLSSLVFVSINCKIHKNLQISAAKSVPLRACEHLSVCDSLGIQVRVAARRQILTACLMQLQVWATMKGRMDQILNEFYRKGPRSFVFFVLVKTSGTRLRATYI